MTGAGHRFGDEGMVLVALIWLLALLGGLTMAMSLFTTSALSTLDIGGDQARADAALKAGLNHAVARLLAQGRTVGQEALAVGGARVSSTWVGETARIDINYAPPDLLSGLFARLGASADAAAAYASVIVGLRGLPPPVPGRPPGYDPDEETPAGIARAAHRLDPTPDPHRPFVDVAQLAETPGLSPAVMTRAAPFLTTFSGIAEIDARLAAPEVLQSLPEMTRERLRSLDELRRRGPDSAGFEEALGPAKAYTTDKPAPAVRITVRAVLADGFDAAAEIVIVAYSRDRQAYRVVSWDDEDAVRQSPAAAESP